MTGYYQRKVHVAWATIFPGVPCPGSSSDTPLSPGVLDEVTGFHFRSVVFDTFGGCSDSTNEFIMSFSKKVADRQGTTPKHVFNRVSGRLCYSIWKFNAQAVIIRRPKSV